MKLDTELLANYLSQENAQIIFPDLQLNAAQIILETAARRLCPSPPHNRLGLLLPSISVCRADTRPISPSPSRAGHADRRDSPGPGGTPDQPFAGFPAPFGEGPEGVATAGGTRDSHVFIVAAVP